MMTAYWKTIGGRVRFDQILEAAGVAMQDLSYMNKHMNGNRNNLCWLGVLGGPKIPGCKLIHEKG